MTQFLLLYTAAIGAISRLLRSAAFKRKAALVGSLALFVAKTRSGAKIVGSYTPVCHRANMLCGLTGMQSACHREQVYRYADTPENTRTYMHLDFLTCISSTVY